MKILGHDVCAAIMLHPNSTIMMSMGQAGHSILGGVVAGMEAVFDHPVPLGQGPLAFIIWMTAAPSSYMDAGPNFDVLWKDLPRRWCCGNMDIGRAAPTEPAQWFASCSIE